ncbi:trace amine-associated receptor 1-like [Antennarius striatus]|uniref:trace amine-associated receptor 1-like n=1 Tax=Antennarius striatus TaxID=241820 RepID=UPI0035AE64CF
MGYQISCILRAKSPGRVMHFNETFNMKILDESELCFPELSNISCRKPRLSHPEMVVTYIMSYVTPVIIVILNLLVIISISHFKQLHTPTNLLLLSLAFSDFFVGLMFILHVLMVNKCWMLTEIVCAFFSILDFTSSSASVGTMVLISVDRYVAICDPLYYSTKITVRTVTVCICLCWFCSFVYNIVLMNDNLNKLDRYISCLGQCVIVIDYIAGAADVIFTFIAPVTVIIVLYMRVFVVAVSQARAMRSHITSVRLSGTVSAKKSELKAARTLGVVIVVFLICLCPYFISSLLIQEELFNATSLPLQNWFFYINSCLNPVIYAFCYSWYRKSIKLIVTLKIFESDSCEASVL